MFRPQISLESKSKPNTLPFYFQKIRAITSKHYDESKRHHLDTQKIFFALCEQSSENLSLKEQIITKEMRRVLEAGASSFDEILNHYLRSVLLNPDSEFGTLIRAFIAYHPHVLPSLKPNLIERWSLQAFSYDMDATDIKEILKLLATSKSFVAGFEALAELQSLAGQENEILELIEKYFSYASNYEDYFAVLSGAIINFAGIGNEIFNKNLILLLKKLTPIGLKKADDHYFIEILGGYALNTPYPELQKEMLDFMVDILFASDTNGDNRERIQLFFIQRPELIARQADKIKSYLAAHAEAKSKAESTAEFKEYNPLIGERDADDKTATEFVFYEAAPQSLQKEFLKKYFQQGYFARKCNSLPTTPLLQLCIIHASHLKNEPPETQQKFIQQILQKINEPAFSRVSILSLYAHWEIIPDNLLSSVIKTLTEIATLEKSTPLTIKAAMLTLMQLSHRIKGEDSLNAIWSTVWADKTLHRRILDSPLRKTAITNLQAHALQDVQDAWTHIFDYRHFQICTELPKPILERILETITDKHEILRSWGVLCVPVIRQEALSVLFSLLRKDVWNYDYVFPILAELPPRCTLEQQKLTFDELKVFIATWSVSFTPEVLKDLSPLLCRLLECTEIQNVVFDYLNSLLTGDNAYRAFLTAYVLTQCKADIPDWFKPIIIDTLNKRFFIGEDGHKKFLGVRFLQRPDVVDWHPSETLCYFVLYKKLSSFSEKLIQQCKAACSYLLFDKEYVRASELEPYFFILLPDLGRSYLLDLVWATTKITNFALHPLCGAKLLGKIVRHADPELQSFLLHGMGDKYFKESNSKPLLTFLKIKMELVKETQVATGLQTYLPEKVRNIVNGYLRMS